jgi:hypothetical protein
LILPHNTFQIAKDPPLLVALEVELRSAIALKLRNPLNTFLEHIFLLFVERG